MNRAEYIERIRSSPMRCPGCGSQMRLEIEVEIDPDPVVNPDVEYSGGFCGCGWEWHDDCPRTVGEWLDREYDTAAGVLRWALAMVPE